MTPTPETETVGTIVGAGGDRETTVSIVEIPREGCRRASRLRVQIMMRRPIGPPVRMQLPAWVAMQLAKHLRTAVDRIEAEGDEPAREDLRPPRRPEPLHTRGGR